MDSLRPEQERALRYAQRRGSEASAAEIASRVRATFAEVEAVAGGLDAAISSRRPSASAWSVLEVVTHLVLSDEPAIQQLRELLAGRDVPTPIPAHLQSPDPFAVDWSELRERLGGIHRQLESVLASAGDDHPLTARATVQMVVKCARPDGTLEPVQWEQRFDWKAYAILIHAHNQEHLAQMKRVLEALPSRAM